MGILHIILGIIKVVGILLLILLGIFLLGILAILFCPVTYRAQGSRVQILMKAMCRLPGCFDLFLLYFLLEVRLRAVFLYAFWEFL